MKCTNCLKDLPDHATFCLECGTRQVVQCECGAILPSDAKYCIDCGNKVQVELSKSETVSPMAKTPSCDPLSLDTQKDEDVPVTKATAPSGGKKRVVQCDECGTILPHDVDCCTKCGSKVEWSNQSAEKDKELRQRIRDAESEIMEEPVEQIIRPDPCTTRELWGNLGHSPFQFTTTGNQQDHYILCDESGIQQPVWKVTNGTAIPLDFEAKSVFYWNGKLWCQREEESTDRRGSVVTQDYFCSYDPVTKAESRIFEMEAFGLIGISRNKIEANGYEILLGTEALLVKYANQLYYSPFRSNELIKVATPKGADLQWKATWGNRFLLEIGTTLLSKGGFFFLEPDQSLTRVQDDPQWMGMLPYLNACCNHMNPKEAIPFPEERDFPELKYRTKSLREKAMTEALDAIVTRCMSKVSFVDFVEELVYFGEWESKREVCEYTLPYDITSVKSLDFSPTHYQNFAPCTQVCNYTDKLHSTRNSAMPNFHNQLVDNHGTLTSKLFHCDNNRELLNGKYAVNVGRSQEIKGYVIYNGCYHYCPLGADKRVQIVGDTLYYFGKVSRGKGGHSVSCLQLPQDLERLEEENMSLQAINELSLQFES